MSKALDIISSLHDAELSEAKVGASRKLAIQVGKLDKEERKFWKDLQKQYPEQKDAYGDPKKGEGGYDEFKDFYKKHKVARKKAFDKFIPLMVTELDDLVKSGDLDAMNAWKKADRKDNYTRMVSDAEKDDYVDGGVVEKILDAYHKISDITSGRAAWRVFQDAFEGKWIDSKIASIRANQFFSQNNLHDFMFEVNYGKQRLYGMQEYDLKDDPKMAKLKVGDKVKVKLWIPSKNEIKAYEIKKG